MPEHATSCCSISGTVSCADYLTRDEKYNVPDTDDLTHLWVKYIVIWIRQKSDPYTIKNVNLNGSRIKSVFWVHLFNANTPLDEQRVRTRSRL